MTIEVSNESGLDVSEEELISVARFVIRRMDVNPAAELSMVLLDTNALLWLVVDPDRIAPRVLERLAAPSTVLLVSAVSAWASKWTMPTLP